MRFIAYLRGANYLTLQFFLFLCLGLTLFAFNTKVYIVLLIPFITVFFFIALLAPQSIPYFFVASNFYGGFVFEKLRFGVTITDLLFFIIVPAYLGSLLTQNNSNDNYYLNNGERKILTILFIFFFSSLLSFFVNISSVQTSYIYVSIWFLIKLIQLPIVYVIFSKLSIQKNDHENCINICLLFSLLQLPVVLYQLYSIGSYEHFQTRTFIHGTLTHHHTLLGTFMLIPFSFALYRFLSTSIKRKKMWYCVIMIILLNIIIFSGSRSALFGIVFSALVFFFFHYRFQIKHIKYFILIIAALVALYFYTPLGENITSTLYSKETYSLDLSSISRFLIWKGAIDHFQSTTLLRKIFGVGIGTYPSIQYNFVVWGSMKGASGAHNNVLHVLCEVGILGLIIYILLFYYILKELHKHFYNLLSKTYFFLTIALLASSFTQETFWFQKSFGSFWLFYTIFLVIVLKQNNLKVDK